MNLLESLLAWCKRLRNQAEPLTPEDKEFLKSVEDLAKQFDGFKQRYESLSIEYQRMHFILLNIVRISNNGPYTEDRFDEVNALAREGLPSKQTKH